MTVKELRATLANYPEDAQVFLYSELGECDGFIDKVTIDKPNIVHDEDWNEDFAYSPYGCNGDSEAQEYFQYPIFQEFQIILTPSLITMMLL